MIGGISLVKEKNENRMGEQRTADLVFQKEFKEPV